mmetsp:Transcript_2720/g.3210  ORF Transcript_2720/g.3210 Transcript_2720/m.3210 type:complete len:107 (+) Transcript_2720:570-890(+)
MCSVSKDTALKTSTWDGWELESSGETLLTLRIVVLQGYLHLNGFNEVTLLSFDFLTTLLDGSTRGVSKDIIHAAGEKLRVKFVGHFDLYVFLQNYELFPSGDWSNC